MTRDVAIVGGDSLIGGALVRRLAKRGIAACATTRRRGRVAPSRPYLDLLDWDGASLDWLPVGCKVVVLAAGMTNQQACANDPAAARLINCELPVHLASVLSESGIRLVFLSTNAVFDGTRPLRRADETTTPIAAYGRLKAETEGLLLAFPGTLVLRLTKVLHRDLPLIVHWRDSLPAGGAVEAFGDLFMAPVALADVAAALQVLTVGSAAGIFHLSGPTDVSYYDFARRLARRLGAAETLVVEASIEQARINPAHAPRHTTLAMGEREAALGLTPPPLEVIIERLV